MTQGINIADHDILSHNLVVFRGGENALQVLPQLVEYVITPAKQHDR